MSGELVGRFFCEGQPRTKGSLTPQMSRGTGGKLRVHLVESGEYAVPWKKKMIRAITHEMNLSSPMMAIEGPYNGAVSVEARFFYERPAAGMARLLPYPTLAAGVYAQGDLDKLERNLLDALTQSGLIKDDSLVVDIVSSKRWCLPGESAGVWCEVRAL